MHLKKFQTTQLFMLFLSKVARSQSPDVSFCLGIKSHVLYFLFYCILLYFTMFCYVLLCFTMFYYNMVLLKPQQTKTNS